MASTSYPAVDFDFVAETPSRDFFCPVTGSLLREPHQTTCCGKHISLEAAGTLQRSNTPCPLCTEAPADVVSTVPDMYFKRQVNEIQVRCPNKSSGCQWEGNLGDQERHLSVGSTEGDCRFEKLDCTFSCGQIIPRHRLASHRGRQCAQRPFTCRFCGHTATHSEITTLHYPQCERYHLGCPNRCGRRGIERRNLPSHRETCPKEMIGCEFRHAGCMAELQRERMVLHKCQNVEEHLSMVGRTIEQQANAIATLQQQVQQLVAAHLEPASPADTPSFIPPPAFIMTNFTRRKNAGSTWHSQPFYSHSNGYKMRLRVDANGTGSGEGTHVSVFVQLIEGEYDDDLPWPFRGAIAFQLVNRRA